MSFGTSRTWLIRHYLESSDDVDELRANVERALTMEPRQVTALKMLLDMDDPRHGTCAGYRAGCTCELCLSARADFHKGRYLRNEQERGELDERECEVCGEIYQPTRKDSRRCPACRQAQPQASVELQRRNYVRTGRRF